MRNRVSWTLLVLGALACLAYLFVLASGPNPLFTTGAARSLSFWSLAAGLARVAEHDGHHIRDSIHQGPYPIGGRIPTGSEPVDAVAPVV